MKHFVCKIELFKHFKAPHHSFLAENAAQNKNENVLNEYNNFLHTQIASSCVFIKVHSIFYLQWR